MSKSIAFFDLDGTLTTKDTLVEISKLLLGKKRTLFLLFKVLPRYILIKLKLYDRKKGKEYFFRLMLKNISETKFQNVCDDFCENHLPTILNKKVYELLTKHKKDGSKVIVVTASAVNWVEKWCKNEGIGIIGTELETFNGYFTGKIKGLNCYGKEKARRINLKFDLSKYDKVYAYGNSKGDKEMLALAHYSYLVKRTIFSSECLEKRYL